MIGLRCSRSCANPRSTRKINQKMNILGRVSFSGTLGQPAYVRNVKAVLGLVIPEKDATGWQATKTAITGQTKLPIPPPNEDFQTNSSIAALLYVLGAKQKGGLTVTVDDVKNAYNYAFRYTEPSALAPWVIYGSRTGTVLSVIAVTTDGGLCEATKEPKKSAVCVKMIQGLARMWQSPPPLWSEPMEQSQPRQQPQENPLLHQQQPQWHQQPQQQQQQQPQENPWPHQQWQQQPQQQQQQQPQQQQQQRGSKRMATTNLGQATQNRVRIIDSACTKVITELNQCREKLDQRSKDLEDVSTRYTELETQMETEGNTAVNDLQIINEDLETIEEKLKSLWW